MPSAAARKAQATKQRKAEEAFSHELALNLAAADKNTWTRFQNPEAKALALKLRRAARTIQTAYRSHAKKTDDAVRRNAASRAGKAPTTYWQDHGKFQTEHDALWRFVPRSGNTRVPHIQLLVAASRVYYDFHNNGNDTFYAVWDNGRYDREYEAPADAPSIVREFFKWGRQRIREVEYYREEEHDLEPDFDKDILEELMDETIRYAFVKQFGRDHF